MDISKAEDGTDVTEIVRVIGVIDHTKPSLQSIDYQVEHSDGNISQLSRVVQVVDLNYSVVADEVISFDDNVSTFEISISGIISLEKISIMNGVSINTKNIEIFRIQNIH